VISGVIFIVGCVTVAVFLYRWALRGTPDEG
jgi:hypothetical protein